MIDDSRVVLSQCVKYYRNKLKTIKGKGIRRKGGNVFFFNDLKQLLKKLENNGR